MKTSLTLISTTEIGVKMLHTLINTLTFPDKISDKEVEKYLKKYDLKPRNITEYEQEFLSHKDVHCVTFSVSGTVFDSMIVPSWHKTKIFSISSIERITNKTFDQNYWSVGTIFLIE